MVPRLRVEGNSIWDRLGIDCDPFQCETRTSPRRRFSRDRTGYRLMVLAVRHPAALASRRESLCGLMWGGKSNAGATKLGAQPGRASCHERVANHDNCSVG